MYPSFPDQLKSITQGRFRPRHPAWPEAESVLAEDLARLVIEYEQNPNWIRDDGWLRKRIDKINEDMQGQLQPMPFAGMDFSQLRSGITINCFKVGFPSAMANSLILDILGEDTRAAGLRTAG